MPVTSLVSFRMMQEKCHKLNAQSQCPTTMACGTSRHQVILHQSVRIDCPLLDHQTIHHLERATGKFDHK
uniref:Uncharacterized protein n=1 Tax=Sarcoptes scabiei TaxID=52283 RepID=A0A834RKT2_SARSC